MIVAAIGIVASLAGGCTTGDASAPTATATIAKFGAGTMTGQATFKQVGTDVTATITLTGCTDAKAYPVHIHDGAACTDAATQGGHWAVPRGEGIPNIVCAGTTGTVTFTRAATPAASAWSVGGDATTNVEGHVVVVHDPDVATLPRIACGVIAP